MQVFIASSRVPIDIDTADVGRIGRVNVRKIGGSAQARPIVPLVRQQSVLESVVLGECTRAGISMRLRLLLEDLVVDGARVVEPVFVIVVVGMNTSFADSCID